MRFFIYTIGICYLNAMHNSNMIYVVTIFIQVIYIFYDKQIIFCLTFIK